MSSVLIRPYNADGSEHSEAYSLRTEDSLECPLCFTQIEIQPLKGVYWSKNNNLQIFLKCKKCNNCFIGYTNYNSKDNIFHIASVSKGNHKTREFPPEVNEVSNKFVQIYCEAEFAEQENLKEICGVGYRKSIEFLIKDYLLKKFPDKAEEIKGKSLSNCISEMIDNQKIKDIAQRAAWLGNDETHYFRKWEDRDLTDLKRLIDITVYFISMDLEADKYMNEMEK